ncbi:MAG: vanadium-dependent haloperoxidase [Saprospiraceae bacterium]
MPAEKKRLAGSNAFWRRIVLFGSLFAASLLLAWAARRTTFQTGKNEYSISLDWNRFILDAETYTEGFRGPVAARTYAYTALAAYEASLPGLPEEFQSLASLYPELTLPPAPKEGSFHLAAALNACYAEILGRYFLSAPANIRLQQQQIKEKWSRIFSRERDRTAILQSEAFGRKVAEAVYQWSATDTLAHMANFHNYDRNYSPPVGKGLWVPSLDFPMPPLLPSWGKVRPMVIETASYLAAPLPPYSSSPDSVYYVHSMEVFSITSPISVENKWIAEFWSDDHPGITFTPAGHWLAIANQVIEKEKPDIGTTLETYVKTGFALCDAVIACWLSKYHYNLERPESFITKHLSPDWRPVNPSPPFPSYPSGHAMMGAAAAKALATIFGDQYELTDKSPETRREFRVKPRHFHSFGEMARENAISRILLGVHYRMDVEEGMRLGEKIGLAVSAIPIRSPAPGTFEPDHRMSIE